MPNSTSISTAEVDAMLRREESEVIRTGRRERFVTPSEVYEYLLAKQIEHEDAIPYRPAEGRPVTQDEVRRRKQAFLDSPKGSSFTAALTKLADEHVDLVEKARSMREAGPQDGETKREFKDRLDNVLTDWNRRRGALVNEIDRAVMEEKLKADQGDSSLRDLLAGKGFYDRIAIERLADALRDQPGCSKIQTRSLNNYISGRKTMPMAVAAGLAKLLGISIERLVEVIEASQISGRL
jgi:hypothetical protein